MLRFHIPLIEPDVRFSRIRLSDKSRSRSGIGRLSRLVGQGYEPERLVQVVAGERARSLPCLLVLATQPSAQPVGSVCIDCSIRTGYRPQAEVVAPAREFLVDRTDHLVGVQ